MGRLKRKICFVTGTRADFGKLKAMMLAVDQSEDFTCEIFVTGMHLLSSHGNTVNEIYKTGFKNVYTNQNQSVEEPVEIVLANTIYELSTYLRRVKPDLLIVHGDRTEALAGAIVGTHQNVLVGHIEGGELSGAIDELRRHAISKLSHLHFASNDESARRLEQLGENPRKIFVIGSPEVDIFLSKQLPSLKKAKKLYEIPFSNYSVAIYHPVTSNSVKQTRYANEFVQGLINSRQNFVVICPNNDPGADFILEAYEKVKEKPGFVILPSMRFEYFIVVLRNAKFIIGNSSTGVREAPVFGVPSINIGSRQRDRRRHETIINTVCQQLNIINAIKEVEMIGISKHSYHFGNGNSAVKFLEILATQNIWRTPIQKRFFTY